MYLKIGEGTTQRCVSFSLTEIHFVELISMDTCDMLHKHYDFFECQCLRVSLFISNVMFLSEGWSSLLQNMPGSREPEVLLTRRFL